MKEYRNMEKRAKEYSIDIYIHALFENLRKICLNLKWDFKFYYNMLRVEIKFFNATY